MRNIITIKFVQITACMNDRQSDLFGLDQYGRIWRWLEQKNNWELIINPKEEKND